MEHPKPRRGAIQKPHPPDGWVRFRAFRIDTGLNRHLPWGRDPAVQLREHQTPSQHQHFNDEQQK